MKIILYSDLFEEKLLEFLSFSEAATIGHLPFWNKVLTKTFGYTDFSMIGLDTKEEIIGYFPFFKTKNLFQQTFLLSSPFNNFSGIIYSQNDELYHLFIAEAKKTAKKYNAQYVEIRQLNENKLNLPERSNFVSMFLTLNSDIKTVWEKSLNSKVRNQVRKSEQNNLYFIENDRIENFYPIYCKNMRDLGSPTFPLSFFKNIEFYFKQNIEILSVTYEGRTIASMLTIKWGKYFSDPWASSLKEYNFLNPNNFLYWNAIKKAVNERYEVFDMGRSTIDTGTYHFKKQWGAIPVKLNYQYIFNNTNKIPSVDAKNNKYELAIKVWKKLPLPLANFFGARLIKFLPEI